MTTPLLRPSATVVVTDADDVPVTDGTVTLDEGWAPYGQAAVTLALDITDALAIDPRDGDRAQVTASVGGTPRTFDMGVRVRTFNYTDRTCTLQLATDEALLQDYAPLADDSTPRTLETSLRGVINYVLGKVIPGKTLNASPSNDANVSAFWPLTNLVINPSFELGVTGWTNGTGGSGLAPTNAKAFSGTYSGHWQQTATGDTWLDGQRISARPGQSYVLSAYFGMIAGTDGTGGVYVRFWNAAGSILGDRPSAMVPVSASGWSRASIVTVAPPGTSQVSFHLRHNGGAGRFPAVDAVMFYEGTEVVPYFDGSTPDSSTYTYDWADPATPHVVTSTRTPVVERDPDLLTWHAGVSAWDFLQPLITQPGLRLFADEARVWRLVPAIYNVDGTVVLTGAVATAADDVISRQDSSLWCQGVVVRYRWTDRTGVVQTRIDAAGTPGRVQVIEYARAFPGPGAAAAILARMTKRGRVQDVSALSNYATTPGMESRAALPSGGEVVGRLRAVVFHLAEGLMDAQAREQTEAPPDSWLGANPATRWTDIPTSVTWANYTP